MQIGFLNEITDKIGGDFDLRLMDKCLIFGGEAVYVEGHLGIEIYSPAEIVLGIKNGKITITGENLKISELSREDILVKGNIKSLQRG